MRVGTKFFFFSQIKELMKLIKTLFRFDQSDENWLYSTVSKLIMFWSFWSVVFFLNFSFRTLINKFKYIKLEASKNDQLWNNRGFQTWTFLKFKNPYSLILLFSYFYVSILNLDRLNFRKKVANKKIRE
jgi:hypothetical protein